MYPALDSRLIARHRFLIRVRLHARKSLDLYDACSWRLTTTMAYYGLSSAGWMTQMAATCYAPGWAEPWQNKSSRKSALWTQTCVSPYPVRCLICLHTTTQINQ